MTVKELIEELKLVENQDSLVLRTVNYEYIPVRDVVRNIKLCNDEGIYDLDFTNKERNTEPVVIIN